MKGKYIKLTLSEDGLYYFDGLTIAEIADLYNTTVSTISFKKREALKKIRENENIVAKKRPKRKRRKNVDRDQLLSFLRKKGYSKENLELYASKNEHEYRTIYYYILRNNLRETI